MKPSDRLCKFLFYIIGLCILGLSISACNTGQVEITVHLVQSHMLKTPSGDYSSVVWLSNDQLSWTQASVQRVWLEGFQANTGIHWDGFTYVVGTGTSDTFRYASITHGGPGALEDDGDDEINGLMGLDNSFHGNPAVPEPGTLGLMGLGLGALSVLGLRRKKA